MKNKFKIFIEKYYNIYTEVFENINFLKMIFNDDKIVVDSEFYQIEITNENDWLNFKFKNLENDEIEKVVAIRFLEVKEENYDPDVCMLETRKENTTNGCIIENITKYYGFTFRHPGQRVLFDLNSKRYVIDENIDITNIDIQKLEVLAIFKTNFESHMKTFLGSYTDSVCSNTTLLNGKDISRIYDIVEGPDKIYRIYDLYNGIENLRNKKDINAIKLGLLNEKAFDYKGKIGISFMENNISEDIAKRNLIK